LLFSAGGIAAWRVFSRRDNVWLSRYAQFGWQLGALLGLEQAYEFTRARIPHETDLALMNAYRVLDLEWRYGFFVEQRIEHFFLQYQAVMNAVYLVYALGHVGVTIGVLTLIYIRRRQLYPFVRNLIMTTTAIALAGYYFYPTAPPRMLTQYGFVDPLTIHHVVGAGGEQPGSYLYNPYAAMPSLHVGYALVVAIGLFLGFKSTWVRVLAVLYPVAMASSVVISGNHWLLDIAGAGVAVAISYAFVALSSRLVARVKGPIVRAFAPPVRIAS
jgi:membrane-associated phospholipid phosphatase